MTYTLVFHPEALEEYKEASIWYESQLTGLGLRFEETIESKIEQIISNPQIYSLNKGLFRQANVNPFPFVIVYKLSDRKKQVYISAIHHTSRHPKRKYRKI